MRIGILGGTFDPPHAGHLALARAACDAAALDRVLLVPARQPPHKRGRPITPARHRLAMARCLAEEDPRLSASDVELRRPPPSYTIDTLRILRGMAPSVSYRLIIGEDMARIFGTWREAEAVLRLAPPLVAARPGTDGDAGSGHGDGDASRPPRLSRAARALLRGGRFPMTPVDLSSTEIRDAFRKGRRVPGALPERVRAYIRREGLYGEAD
jgi:nicotinate-nucleotide adenylyltransferase